MRGRQVESASGSRRYSLVVAGAAIVLGVGLLITPFVASLFSRTTAANHLTDTVRPAMTQQAIASGSTDLANVQTAYGQLANGLLPAMAAKAHETPAALIAQLRTTYPEIRAGMDNFDTAVANAHRILVLLGANRDRYVAADSLPVSGVPLTVAPWAYLGVGAGFVLLGVACLRRPEAGLAALIVVALAVAIVPLATSEPSKLSDTKALVHNLHQTLSPQAAATARAQYTTFDTMLTTFDTKALPAFAHQTHLSTTQVDAMLTTSAPLLAPGAPDVPRILKKFSGLTVALVSQVGNYDRTGKIPFDWMAWLLVVPGFVLAALAALALVSGRSQPESSTRKATEPASA